MALRCAVRVVGSPKAIRAAEHYREMPQIIAALEATVKCEGVDTKAKIA
jgi:hypothetical protein